MFNIVYKKYTTIFEVNSFAYSYVHGSLRCLTSQHKHFHFFLKLFLEMFECLYNIYHLYISKTISLKVLIVLPSHFPLCYLFISLNQISVFHMHMGYVAICWGTNYLPVAVSPKGNDSPFFNNYYLSLLPSVEVGSSEPLPHLQNRDFLH